MKKSFLGEKGWDWEPPPHLLSTPPPPAGRLQPHCLGAKPINSHPNLLLCCHVTCSMLLCYNSQILFNKTSWTSRIRCYQRQIILKRLGSSPAQIYSVQGLSTLIQTCYYAAMLLCCYAAMLPCCHVTMLQTCHVASLEVATWTIVICNA